VLNKVLTLLTKVLGLLNKVLALLTKVLGLLNKVLALLTKVLSLLNKVLALLTKVLSLLNKVLALLTKVLGLLTNDRTYCLLAQNCGITPIKQYVSDKHFSSLIWAGKRVRGKGKEKTFNL